MDINGLLTERLTEMQTELSAQMQDVPEKLERATRALQVCKRALKHAEESVLQLANKFYEEQNGADFLSHAINVASIGGTIGTIGAGIAMLMTGGAALSIFIASAAATAAGTAASVGRKLILSSIEKNALEETQEILCVAMQVCKDNEQTQNALVAIYDDINQTFRKYTIIFEELARATGQILDAGMFDKIRSQLLDTLSGTIRQVIKDPETRNIAIKINATEFQVIMNARPADVANGKIVTKEFGAAGAISLVLDVLELCDIIANMTSGSRNAIANKLHQKARNLKYQADSLYCMEESINSDDYILI